MNFSVWNEKHQDMCVLLFLVFLLGFEGTAYYILNGLLVEGQVFCICPLFVWGAVCFICFLAACVLMWSYHSEVAASKSIYLKFLNNSLGGRKWSKWFLLLFVFHLSWLSDTSFEVFLDLDYSSISNFAVSFLGMFMLIKGFPVNQNQHRQEKFGQTLLVTGSSQINTNSERVLGLFFKPFQTYRNIQHVIVLFSDDILKEYYKGHGIKGSSKNNDDEAVAEYRDRLRDYFFREFPDYPNGENVEFIFTRPLDFNEFENCYEELDEVLCRYEKKLEKGSRDTLIHISPGTKIVTAILTIFGIKLGRTLLYTRQDNSQLDHLDLDVLTLKDMVDEWYNEKEEMELAN